MKKLLKIARWCRIIGAILVPFVRVAEVTFVIVMLVIFWPMRPVEREGQATLKSYGDIARTVQPLIVPTSQNVNAILLQAGIATGEMAQASIEQRKYWQSVSEHTIDAIGDAQDAIKEWGAAGGAARAEIAPTFGQFRFTLSRADDLLQTANDQAKTISPFMRSATSFMTHADALASDPAWHATLINLQGVSGDVGHVTHRFAYPPHQSIFRRTWALFPLAKDTAEMGFYLSGW